MRRRTELGSRVLVSGALGSGAALAPRLTDRTMRRLERLWARAIASAVGLTIELDGADLIDPATQYIVMPLHESFVDIPALLHLPLDLRFTVREELLALPKIGPYLAATGQIPIPEAPTRSELRALSASIDEVLATGASVVMFPQGSILGVETAFASGARWIARSTGLPVLPVVIAGTHQVWEYPFSTTVRFGRSVTLRVGESIPAVDLSRSRMRTLEQSMKRTAIASPNPVRHFVPARDGWWDGYRFDIDPDFTELHQAFAAHRSSGGDPHDE